MDILAEGPPQVIHNHMYRPEVIGTRAALALTGAVWRVPLGGHPALESVPEHERTGRCCGHSRRPWTGSSVRPAIVAKRRAKGRDSVA